MGEKKRMKIEIEWIVKKKSVEGMEEIEEDEINGMSEGIGEKDLKERNVDEMIEKEVGEMMEKGEEEKRIEISGEVDMVVEGNGEKRKEKGIMRKK